jgi:hypothetical protein
MNTFIVVFCLLGMQNKPPYSTNEDRYLACGSKNTKIPVFSNKVDGDAEKIFLDVAYIFKLFAFQVP